MRDLRYLPALFVGLLLLAGAATHSGAAEKSKADIEREGEKFARSYDADWNKTFKTMIDEVRRITDCGDDVRKSLVEDVKPLAEKLKKHWQVVYLDYYQGHYKDFSNNNFWDDYPQMLSADLSIKGLAELNQQWEAVLKARLTPAQMDLWLAEMKRRHERWQAAGEAWLKKRLEKLEKTARQDYEGRLAGIVQSSGLSEERAKEFKKAVDDAVAASMAVNRPYGEKSVKAWGQDFTYYREERLKSLENTSFPGYRSSVGAAAQAADKVFDAEVAKLLRPEEKEKAKATKGTREGRIATIAKNMADRVRDGYRQQREMERKGRISRLASSVGMDEQRRKAFEDKLNASEKKIDEQWTKDFIAYVTKQVHSRVDRGNTDQQLKEMEQRNWWYTDQDTDQKANKAREAAWTEALKTSVSPEESARWETDDKLDRERRARVMALMATAELDHRLMLQPEQRQAFEKLALEAAKPVAEVTTSLNDVLQQNADSALMLVHAVGMKKVEDLLDEPQKKQLKEVAGRYEYYWTRIQQLLPKKK